MESNLDQTANAESTIDQPEAKDNVSDETQETSQESLYEVNGQKMSGDKLLNSYKELQKAFTQKSQELKKASSQETLSDDEKAALDFLKDNNFLTKEDLESGIKNMERQNNLDKIMSSSPELRKYEWQIKELGKTNPDLDYDDIIEKAGLSSKEKLAKAKDRGLMGMPSTPAKEERKSVANMTNEEFAAYKKSLGIRERF